MINGVQRTKMRRSAISGAKVLPEKCYVKLHLERAYFAYMD